jgi:hypothetical protein
MTRYAPVIGSGGVCFKFRLIARPLNERVQIAVCEGRFEGAAAAHSGTGKQGDAVGCKDFSLSNREIDLSLASSHEAYRLRHQHVTRWASDRL